MKKWFSVFLVLCLIFSISAFAEEAAPALEKDLVILYTSDVHCGISQGWGYAGLYEIKESLSEKNHVLLVDDGDAIQGEPVGTLSEGEAIINLMNAVGYDIAIPGNHEFDYGMERFFELVKKADFEYISCNFNKKGELIFAPYTIREFDGVKIGFVGVTTPLTLRTSTPKYFQDENGEYIYGFDQAETGDKLYNAVQKAVDDCRAEGVKYVIVMAHVGNETESSPWMYDEIIANTTGIDIWLDGHSHDTDQTVVKNKNGEDVYRSACGTKFANIGLARITKDGKISTELLGWDSSIAAPELLKLDNPVAHAVEDEFEELNAVLGETIAKTDVDLVIFDPEAKTSEGKPVRIIRKMETNLGDLCADAYLDQAGDADIAFINGGGIRVNINAGDITFGDVLKVHPYGNQLTVIELTGQQVLDALEWSVHSLPGEFGGFNQVAGMTFEYDDAVPTPCVEDKNGMFDHIEEGKERRVCNVLVAGEPLDPAKKYKLVSIDYQLLDAGDGYTMYKGATVLQQSVKLDNQVLIDYIKNTLHGVIGEGYDKPYGQGRIVPVKK